MPKSYSIKQVCLALIALGFVSFIGTGFGYYYITGLLEAMRQQEPSIVISLRSASGILMIFPAIALWAYAGHLYHRQLLYSAKINISFLTLVIIVLSAGNLWVDSSIHRIAAQYGYTECKALYHCNTPVSNNGSQCFMTFTLPGYCTTSSKGKFSR